MLRFRRGGAYRAPEWTSSADRPAPRAPSAGGDDRGLGSRSRRSLLADGTLASASDAALPFLPVCLVALGASAVQVGLLSGATALAGLLALVPAAWLARRTRSRKLVVLLGRWGFARLAVAGQLAKSALVLRFRSRQLFVLAIAGIAAAPVAWVLITEPWQAALPVLIGGTAWAICHLAVFKLLIEYAPREDLPEYAAARQRAVLGVGLVGALVGSVLVASWGIVPLFLFAAAGRLLAIPILVAPIPPGLRHTLTLYRLRARYRLKTALGLEP